MHEEKPCLRAVPFFSSLDEETLSHLIAISTRHVYAPGEHILIEGEPAHQVYFVLRGEVKVSRLSLEGREQVLAYLGPGEPFNLVPMFDGRGVHPSSVRANTEAVILAVDYDDFRAFLLDHPPMVLALLERCALRLRQVTALVEELALHTVRARLARFILEQAGDSDRRWTQNELAACIGTVREMVGRTLRAFAEEGLIRRERGRIVVVDEEGLRRAAHS